MSQSRLSVLGGIPMFRELTQGQLHEVMERMRERLVPSGTRLIEEGDPGETLFVIVNGSVKVGRLQPDGREVILAVLGPGQVVGEPSVADEVKNASSVTALEDALVLWLEGADFRRMLDEMASMRSGFIEHLCRRLRLADTRLEALAALDVEGRVARVLLALARDHGTPKPAGGLLIPLPLTQSDVAAMTGASRVRVNQVIAKFRRHGWVTLDGRRRISIHDVAALEARCR